MKKILPALAIVACIVPALAFAAEPAKKASFRYCESKNNCPLTFKTNKTGTKLKKLSMYNQCAQIPAEYPKVPVNDEGEFSKSGSTTDATGQKLDFKIEGKFTKPGKATGTYDIDRRGCNRPPVEFVAKKVD